MSYIIQIMSEIVNVLFFPRFTIHKSGAVNSSREI